MPANPSSGKLAYVAIMLVAAGCLLLYIIRTNSRSGNDPGSVAVPRPASPQPTAATPEATRESVMAAGDAEAIKRALAAGMDVKSPLANFPGQDLTPMHVAAARSIPGLIASFVASGADVDARSADGRTPLMIAAAEGSAQLISELLVANAAIDIRDHHGRTALMHAAGAARAEAVDALIKAGADVNALDSSGTSALAYAAAIPANLPSMTLLIAAKADPEAADGVGVTPLMRAAERADAAQIVLLLNAGASPVVKSRDGRNALDRARSRTDDRGKEVAGVLDQAGS